MMVTMIVYLDNNVIFSRSANEQSSVFLIHKVSDNFGGLFRFIFLYCLIWKHWLNDIQNLKNMDLLNIFLM